MAVSENGDYICQFSHVARLDSAGNGDLMRRKTTCQTHHTFSAVKIIHTLDVDPSSAKNLLRWFGDSLGWNNQVNLWYIYIYKFYHISSLYIFDIYRYRYFIYMYIFDGPHLWSSDSFLTRLPSPAVKMSSAFLRRWPHLQGKHAWGSGLSRDQSDPGLEIWGIR